MKFYYYEYETTVLLSWDDPYYELYQGVLVESPFGISEHSATFEEIGTDEYESLEQFIKCKKLLLPRNFQIVELK